MSKFSCALCLSLVCLLALLLRSSAAAPQPQQPHGIVPAEAEDLATGAAAESEKDDLQGSSSYGYGYYSSYPYLGGLGGYYGGYYPYYSGYGGYGGFGYPYYGGYNGGYYGGYNGYHGHYF